MSSPPAGADAASTRSRKKSAMSEDQIVGDGGNLTVYERPDGSRYALDKRGRGSEWEASAMVFGNARYDSRELATGRWEDSRSISEDPIRPDAIGNRGRRRGSRFRTR